MPITEREPRDHVGHRPHVRRETHYVRWDEPGGRFKRALCGRLTMEREVAAEPSCARCAALLTELESMCP